MMLEYVLRTPLPPGLNAFESEKFSSAQGGIPGLGGSGEAAALGRRCQDVAAKFDRQRV